MADKVLYTSMCPVLRADHMWEEVFKLGKIGLHKATCRYCGAEWAGLQAEKDDLAAVFVAPKSDPSTWALTTGESIVPDFLKHSYIDSPAEVTTPSEPEDEPIDTVL